jgi:hypothetical protein
MTDNLAVPLAGAFDALDLAIPTKPPTLDPDCHEACGCRPRSLRLVFRCNACSDTPGRPMTLDTYADP